MTDTKKPHLSGFFYFTSVDDQVGALREIRTPGPLLPSHVPFPA